MKYPVGSVMGSRGMMMMMLVFVCMGRLMSRMVSNRRRESPIMSEKVCLPFRRHMNHLLMQMMGSRMIFKGLILAHDGIPVGTLAVLRVVRGAVGNRA